MLRELADLREDARGLAEGLALARYRRSAGLAPATTFAGLLKAHRLAASADGIAQAREALGNAKAEDPRRPARVARLTALRDLLVRARALSLEPGAAQELFDSFSRPLVRPPGDAGLHGAMPPVAAFRELRFIRARDKRAEMDAAISAALQPFDGARSAVWEAAQSALAEAGLVPAEVYQAYTSYTSGLLDGTDALVQDLGGWLLERHTGVRGGAERHDVLHLLWSPRCASAFPRGELLRTVRRWAEMLRFDLGADGAIKLDEDDRPLKWPGARAEPIDPPWEVGLTFLPEEGPRALGRFLAAIGVAQLRAGPPGDAPPEDLWLGDPAVVHACAALLEGLLHEPEFLRRCAKAELSRDDERAIAIAGVFDARLAAARALASQQAHDLGLGSRAAAAHRELHARATGADLPAGLALADLDPFGEPAFELAGRALAARLRLFLRDRYDEDWWRNPRTATSLNALWGRGGRPTAADLWAEMGSPAGIDALVDELIESCR